MAAEFHYDQSVPIDLGLWHYLERTDSTTKPLVHEFSARHGHLRLMNVHIIRPGWDCSYDGPFRGVYMVPDQTLLILSLATGEYARDLLVFNYAEGDTGIKIAYDHPDADKPLVFSYNFEFASSVENSA